MLNVASLFKLQTETWLRENIYNLPQLRIIFVKTAHVKLLDISKKIWGKFNKVEITLQIYHTARQGVPRE